MLASTHMGALKLGTIDLEVHVLEDGQAMLSGRQLVQSVLGTKHGTVEAATGSLISDGALSFPSGSGSDSATEAPLRALSFLNSQSGTPANGYTTDQVVTILEAYVVAAHEGRLRTDRQREIATRCAIFLAGCARVGLRALVYEACGYQPRGELAEHLETSVAKVASNELARDTQAIASLTVQVEDLKAKLESHTKLVESTLERHTKAVEAKLRSIDYSLHKPPELLEIENKLARILEIDNLLGISRAAKREKAPEKPLREKAPTQAECERFLRHVLRNGPKLESEIFDTAEKGGFPKRQVERARVLLDIWSKKSKDGKGWLWSLPELDLRTADSEDVPF